MAGKGMQKLESKDYERARAILSDLAGVHLHVAAILDGTSAGEVHVDDVAWPQTVCVEGGPVYYLAGDAGNQAFNAALNAMLPRDTYYVLFYDPALWGAGLAPDGAGLAPSDADPAPDGAGLETVVAGTYALRARRRYYTLRQLQLPDWQERVPDGLAMQPVDAGLLAGNLENVESVKGWLLDGWRSVEQFLEEGFGYCLVHNSRLVSWSLVDYVSGDRCEIGISTDRAYRKKGFGTLTAAANAAQAVSRGFGTVGWHCWDNNAGSIGVAGNVGFEKAADYDVYINHWVAENITDMSRDEFRGFAEYYEGRFAARPPAGGYPHIVAAKAWALGGDRAGCYRHLNKAVDLGWLRGSDHLREIWPELFWNPNLDQHKEWRELVKRFEPATPGQELRRET